MRIIFYIILSIFRLVPRQFHSHNLYLVYVVSLLFSCSNPQVLSKETIDFEILKYNNPGLIVYLAVGLWASPLPIDYNGDGKMDLLVSCVDKPFNGLYLFKNKTGGINPVFDAPIRIGNGIKNMQVSYLGGKPRFMVPGREILNIRDSNWVYSDTIYPVEEILKDFKRTPRFNQWKIVDYDNDGIDDIIVGVDDWVDYYSSDSLYNENGDWVNGPLHGYIYLLRGKDDGTYTNAGRIQAGGKVIDVYGAPSPSFEDFDNDGDLDIICGEFVDRLTWFENIGTREDPLYAEGRFLENSEGVIKMDLQMIMPTAVDWDGDGFVDLVIGDEDGRVAFLRNTGMIKDRMPIFESPIYFKQYADNVKFGALSTPFSTDWDDDGDEDLIVGNSAGQIGFIENLGGMPIKWGAPQLLESHGKAIRITAGINGSIQGPSESKWGYTALSVADWDGDGLKDIIVNTVLGKVIWYKNIGVKGSPILDIARPVLIDWQDDKPVQPEWNWYPITDKELVTQWRTTPFAIDWNKDGLMDLIMLDHEGYLSFYERTKNEQGILVLNPGKRIFSDTESSGYDYKHRPKDSIPGLLRLNANEFGRSGRVKFAIADWNNDGTLDLILNSTNVSLMLGQQGKVDSFSFHNQGLMGERVLSGHSTSPTAVRWNETDIPDLLVGAEDGHFYYLKNRINQKKMNSRLNAH